MAHLDDDTIDESFSESGDSDNECDSDSNIDKLKKKLAQIIQYNKSIDQKIRTNMSEIDKFKTRKIRKYTKEERQKEFARLLASKQATVDKLNEYKYTVKRRASVLEIPPDFNTETTRSFITDLELVDKALQQVQDDKLNMKKADFEKKLIQLTEDINKRNNILLTYKKSTTVVERMIAETINYKKYLRYAKYYHIRFDTDVLSCNNVFVACNYFHYRSLLSNDHNKVLECHCINFLEKPCQCWLEFEGIDFNDIIFIETGIGKLSFIELDHETVIKFVEKHYVKIAQMVNDFRNSKNN